MMNAKKEDQRWQQLEIRINKMVHQFMRRDLPAIEHKPRHFALLELQQNNKNNPVKDFT